VVQPQHGPLVVDQERLVGGEELDLVEVVVVHTAGRHERQRALDLRPRWLRSARPRRGAHEVLVPVVHHGEVGHAGAVSARTRFIAADALA
jgi:hypothetical protein